MRRALVAGNWKMNGARASVRDLAGAIKSRSGQVSGVDIAVCPPFVYLPLVQSLLEGSSIALGAQNLCQSVAAGAYTGEVSGAMLKDFGCSYVIVGHSERRALYGESDAFVAQKFFAAREAGLRPIFCVGELLEERERGETEAVVARQLDAVLTQPGAALAMREAVVAYEPVWAIGTGRTASPEQAQDVHAFIRGRLAGLDAGMAERMRVLYGGSVKAANAPDLFKMPDIDGGLIGGASLDAGEFLAICGAAR